MAPDRTRTLISELPGSRTTASPRRWNGTLPRSGPTKRGVSLASPARESSSARSTPGCTVHHPTLVNQYRGNLGGGVFDHNYNWFDFVNGQPAPYDDNDHGTFGMGVAVGRRRRIEPDRRGAGGELDCRQGVHGKRHLLRQRPARRRRLDARADASGRNRPGSDQSARPRSQYVGRRLYVRSLVRRRYHGLAGRQYPPLVWPAAATARRVATLPPRPTRRWSSAPGRRTRTT